jgi:magnesium-transporting ATPase (P-type)
MLGAQMVHLFALLLWAAAALAVIGSMPQLGVAIAVVVVLNGVFSFVQEFRADRAADALRDLVPHRVTCCVTDSARTSTPSTLCSVTSSSWRPGTGSPPT